MRTNRRAKAHRLLRRWILIGLGSLLTPALLIVVALFGLYFRGLRLAEPQPVYQSVGEQSALIRTTLYAEFEGPVEPALRPLNPISFVFLVTCTVKRNDCSQRFPGYQIASLLARELSPPIRGFDRHLAHSSLTIWLTRNWSLNEMLDTFADRGYFAKEARGISQASRLFFDAEPSTLTPDQVAILALFTRSPAHFTYLAACDPADLMELRDDLLEDMIQAGTLSNSVARRAIRVPTAIRVEGVDCR